MQAILIFNMMASAYWLIFAHFKPPVTLKIVLNVQECDARADAVCTAAGFINICLNK